MPKLWYVPNRIDEVFYKASEYSVVVGTTLSEAPPQQPGSRFIGIVDAQLTDRDVLTKQGQKYCDDWGVDKNPYALRQWAACKCV